MKFPALRRYIQSKVLSLPHIIKNGDILVIDGDSYFKDTYRKSGCQFPLGPDCDRYAEFITNKLRIFLENNVKLYVILRGATNHDLEKRKEIHQNIIDRNFAKVDYVKYFQPLLIDDVQKQVLDNMGIKYFVCEYDSTGDIVGVARKFKCPVLTNNIELSVFGVSCIPANSVEYQNVSQIICKIYEHIVVKTNLGVYNKVPMLLVLLKESEDYLESLPELREYKDSDVIGPIIRWVKRQREPTFVSMVTKRIGDEDQKNTFMNNYEKIQTVFLYPQCNLAVKYFQRDEAYSLFNVDKKWFAKGVSSGKIAIPYVNLKRKGVICGSLLINDVKRPDALLAAVDIIIYSHCLLTNSQDSTITFLGRDGKKSSITEIVTHWNKEITNRDIFTKHLVGKKLKLLTKESDPFDLFLKEVLPGFNLKKLLCRVTEDCWILIITLVYYVFKKNKDFINGAYCILLSYFILGPMSKVGNRLKKYGDMQSEKLYNGLQFLFEKVNLTQNYNSTIVHDFAEFQHCLQHMNYLNKLCGETIPCTIFQKTYNATFIYNTFLFMKDKEHLMEFLENRFGNSSSLNSFKSIISSFENCLSGVKKFAKEIARNSDEFNKTIV